MLTNASHSKRTRGIAALSIALAVASVACHEDGQLYQSHTGSATFSIIASASAPGEHVDVVVLYQRPQAASIPIATQTFQLAASGDQQLKFAVDLNACLSDPSRLIPAPETCSLIASLALKDANNVTLDSSAVGPFTAAAGATVQGQALPLRAVGVVNVTTSKVTMNVGDTATATAVVRDRDNNVIAGRSVTWNTSNPTILSVTANGKFASIALGTANIIATVQGVQGTSAPVAVTGVPVATVTLNLSRQALLIGSTSVSTVVARDAQGNIINGRDIQFASSNGAVTDISSTGVVTAVGLGFSDITATVEGHSSTVRVDVVTLPLAIAVADQPQTATYTASGFVSTGGSVTVIRQGVGDYLVRFNGFGAPNIASFGFTLNETATSANIGLTAMGPHCYIQQFTLSQPLIVIVQCRSMQTQGLADAPFRLMVFGNLDRRLASLPAGYSFSVHADTISAGPITPASNLSFSVPGAPITTQLDIPITFTGQTLHKYGFTTSNTGRYVTPLVQSTTQVPACEIRAAQDAPEYTTTVVCFQGASGTATKMQHLVFATSRPLPDHLGASIFFDGPTGSFFPGGSWSDGTGLQIQKTGVGKYSVILSGQDALKPLGIMVSSEGEASMITCSHFIRAVNPLTVDIACGNRNGVFVDPAAGVSLLVVR